jgi:hypothetical protein
MESIITPAGINTLTWMAARGFRGLRQLGVSADVLLASPSVRMDFHDSPANHHADMAKKYPKNYKAARPDQKATGRDEHRDERGGKY